MIDSRLSAALPDDAVLAAALFCVDPVGTGGVVLRGYAESQRDLWLRQVADWLPAGSAMRTVPLNIEEDRLLGGLDLVATLARGKPVARQGLLIEADGGVLLLHSADRLADRCAAHLAAVLDSRQVATERHGVATCMPSRVGIVAFDTGAADDPRPPAKLLDRLSFHLDFEMLPAKAAPAPLPALQRDWVRSDIAFARQSLPGVEAGVELCEAICEAALALGIDSMRAPLLTLRVACASAALHHRTQLSADDAALAVRLVLGPRATAFPAETSQDQEDTDDAAAGSEEPSDLDQSNAASDASHVDPAPSSPVESTDRPNRSEPRAKEDSAVARGHGDAAEVLLQAAAASLPPGLLNTLKAGPLSTVRSQRAGRVGAVIKGMLRGRPDGYLAGAPRGGARVNLIETLRAAAPWQAIRRATDANPQAHAAGASASAVQIRRADFRITRFKQRNETTTLFAVDASGSAALHRLAEAKGAVELLLASCYARRDSVSLIAFRGRDAQVLLPPTRSLVRAKRTLAGLAGGGGTPLATAIDVTLALAVTTRQQGRTPIVVVLTDGRANVARDGTGGRERATIEALDSARRLRAAGITSLVLDTSLHPQQPARDLAAGMGAVYYPLPHADATSLARAMRSTAQLGAESQRAARR
ncbi:Magnesium chelatase ATPase subunit D [Burkholderiales bacterium 8X]|nr:Magnesium chelatase ATPase subunit D [Burkholderiales bacterium 8X]